MNVSYINVLKNATLAATNENINRPVTNIIHNFLELAFYATGNNSVITITLDSLYDINHIAFDYHNIDTMVVRLYDNLGALLDTQNVTVEQDCNFVYFDTVQDVKTITITITTLSALLYIGGISMGEYSELPRFQQSPEGELELRDSYFSSLNGQTGGNRNRPLLTQKLSFANIPNDQKNEFNDYLIYVQNSMPHFIDMYPDAHNYFSPFWGKAEIKNFPQAKRRISTFEYNLEITYKECR